MTSPLSKATENLRSIMGECTRPEINTDTIRAETEARARASLQARQELSSQAQQRTYESLAKCSNAAMRMEVLIGRLNKSQQSPIEMLRILARHLDASAQSKDFDDIHATLGETIVAIKIVMDQIEERRKK
jgi:hypothetical protein